MEVTGLTCLLARRASISFFDSLITGPPSSKTPSSTTARAPLFWTPFLLHRSAMPTACHRAEDPQRCAASKTPFPNALPLRPDLDPTVLAVGHARGDLKKQEPRSACFRLCSPSASFSRAAAWPHIGSRPGPHRPETRSTSAQDPVHIGATLGPHKLPHRRRDPGWLWSVRGVGPALVKGGPLCATG